MDTTERQDYTPAITPMTEEEMQEWEQWDEEEWEKFTQGE